MSDHDILSNHDTAEQIQAVRDSLPSLGPLSRAMKIHEIFITADGVVKSKNLPTDVFYDNVKINVSRRYRRVETVLCNRCFSAIK